MNRIGIFYGSSSGNTEYIAKIIKKQFGNKADLFDVNDIDYNVEKYDLLILGSSTWGMGDLQDDFELFLTYLSTANLKSKTIAIFGLGDSSLFADTFANSIGHIYNVIKEAKVIGKVTADDYNFEASTFVENGYFYGLPIDLENEPQKTTERVINWVKEIKKSFDIND